MATVVSPVQIGTSPAPTIPSNFFNFLNKRRGDEADKEKSRQISLALQDIINSTRHTEIEAGTGAQHGYEDPVPDRVKAAARLARIPGLTPLEANQLNEFIDNTFATRQAQAEQKSAYQAARESGIDVATPRGPVPVAGETTRTIIGQAGQTTRDETKRKRSVEQGRALAEHLPDEERQAMLDAKADFDTVKQVYTQLRQDVREGNRQSAARKLLEQRIGAAEKRQKAQIDAMADRQDKSLQGMVDRAAKREENISERFQKTLENMNDMQRERLDATARGVQKQIDAADERLDKRLEQQREQFEKRLDAMSPKQFDQTVDSKWGELKGRNPDYSRDDALRVVQEAPRAENRLRELYGTIESGQFEVLKNKRIPYTLALKLIQWEVADGYGAAEAASRVQAQADTLYNSGRLVPSTVWATGDDRKVADYLVQYHGADVAEAQTAVDMWKETGVFDTRVAGAGGVPSGTPSRPAVDTGPESEIGEVSPEQGTRMSDMPPQRGEEVDINIPEGVEEDIIRSPSDWISRLNKKARDAVLSTLGIDPEDVPFLLPEGK